MQVISVVKEMAANAAEGMAGARNVGNVREWVFHWAFFFFHFVCSVFFVSFVCFN